MSATTASPPSAAAAPARPGRRLHPVPVRVMHWANAVAMLVMIGSGWGIYNDSVIFGGLHFAKEIKLGSWAAQSLLWQFAGMWLLAVNGAAYLIYGTAPLRRGRTGGSNGAMCAQRSSDTRGLPMPPRSEWTYSDSRFC